MQNAELVEVAPDTVGLADQRNFVWHGRGRLCHTARITVDRRPSPARIVACSTHPAACRPVGQPALIFSIFTRV